MDAVRFDRLARALSAPSTRRSLLGLALGSLFGALGLGFAGPRVEAKKKGRHHKPKPKKCKHGTIKCGKKCVNPKTNALNCGRCGQRCGENRACVNGQCQTGCPSGQLLCGALCVDPSDNEEHCGRCNNPCADPLTCVDGECIASGCDASDRFCDNLGLCIPGDDPDRCCVARDCGGIFENPFGDLECTAQGHCVCKNAGEGRCSSATVPSRNFLCDVCCGDGEGCPAGQVCKTGDNMVGCECDRDHGYQQCSHGCTHVLGDDVSNCGRCDNVCCFSPEDCASKGMICHKGNCLIRDGSRCGTDGICLSGLCKNGTCTPCSSPNDCTFIGQACSGGRCCTPSGESCFAGFPYGCCSESCVMVGVDNWRCA